MSPDGREIAVVVSTPDWNTDKATHEIDLIDVATRARWPLTRYSSDISSPRWSPDETRLAFIAGDTTPTATTAVATGTATATEKHEQVFVLPMDGGDALRVTDASRGVVSFAWSPDGAG